MKISVGIVVYENSVEELSKLLRSIAASIRYLEEYRSDAVLEVLFFDNGESRYPFFGELASENDVHFQIRRCGTNLGFGGAHNQLMKESFESGAMAYIAANPDGFFHYRCMDELYKLSESDNHSALIEARQIPAELAKFYDPVTLETDWCGGACLWITRDVYQCTQGFDENIFMYCEDVDIAWRVQDSQRKTLLCPTAWYYHDLTQRIENTPRRKKQLLMGARHLGYKWSCTDFAHKMELQLFKRGLVSSEEEFSELPKATHEYGKKMIFGFCTRRW